MMKYFLIGIFVIACTSVGAQKNLLYELEQIPSKAGNYADQITAITQDSLGLIWLFGNYKWYVSNGYEIEEVALPFLTNGAEVVRGFYGKTATGNFYFGGEKVRVFNPYLNKISRTISIDDTYHFNDAKPYLYNIAFANDSLIWAVYAPLNHLNLTFPGYNIMQARDGQPFRPVGIQRKTGILNSQNMTVRGEELFICAVDSILQFDASGQLVKAHLLPPSGTKPLAANLVATPTQEIQFLHYVYDPISAEYSRALYALSSSDTSFSVLPVPELNRIAIERMYQTDQFLWVTGPSFFGRFSPTGSSLVPFSGLSDGISNVFEDWSGTYWLGSAENGVMQIKGRTPNPSRWANNGSIQLAKLSVFDQQEDSLITYPLSSRLDTIFYLEPYQDYFEVEIFISNYQNVAWHRFSYLLEGYDSNWSAPSSDRIIKYNKLPSGKYTLKLRGYPTKASDEYLEKQFVIIVKQIWYRTWWAISCFFIAAVGGIYGMYWLFQYQLARRLKIIDQTKQQELQILKEKLYTNFIHEFRTPLTVIMGMTQNIKGHVKERKMIYRNSQNLLRLVNQMLDFAKSQSGGLQLQLIYGDMISYLRYLTESFHSMAREKDIQLTFYSEVPEQHMDFDQEKVQYIMYNLLSNALKFTAEKGKVIVHVNDFQEKQKHYLRIKVQDNGIGIEAAQFTKIFDRFYQVEALGRSTYQGTGIGLSFTKEIVQFLNGKMEVESKVGIGSSFNIFLPITSHQGASTKEWGWIKEPSWEEEVDRPSSIIPDAQKGLLLIVEDNVDVVEYIKSIVVSKFKVLVAKDGVEGVDRALEKMPDIIISDVMMPRMDGLTLCETLKTDDRTSHIPIILLTAKATIASRLEGLEKGADAYLAKPFQREELLLRLDKLVELRKRLQKHFNATGTLLEAIRDNKEPTPDQRFVQTLLRLIKQRLDDPDLSVVDLCRAVKRSNTQVNRKLKALTGKTPSQFIRFVRLQHALELLKTSDLNISEIAYQVGFSNANYFSRAFSEEFGTAPSGVRK